MTKGIKAKDIRDFEKCAEKLNSIIGRIREYAPEAAVYATPNELYLMAGFLDDRAPAREEQAEMVVTSRQVQALESGDW